MYMAGKEAAAVFGWKVSVNSCWKKMGVWRMEEQQCMGESYYICRFGLLLIEMGCFFLYRLLLEAVAYTELGGCRNGLLAHSSNIACSPLILGLSFLL